MTEPKIKSGQICFWRYFSYRYGRYRAMMQVTPKGGQYWWAMWLIEGNGFEIDIEFMDQDSKGFTCTLHSMIDGKKQIEFTRHFRFGVDLSEAKHLYEIDWQPDRISWYLDSVELCRYTGKHIPACKLGLIINNAVSRGFKPDGIPESKLRELFPMSGYVGFVEILKKT